MIHSLSPEGDLRQDARRKVWCLAGAALLGMAAFIATHAAAAADPARISKYEVVQGDTLSGIASRFGIDVETIVRANSLGSADRIQPGQVLMILPVSGAAHTVRAGDTLIGIAARYDVEVATVMRFNEMDDPDHIVIGSDLILPGARLPRVETAPAPARPVAPAAPVTPQASAPAPAPAVGQESSTDLGRSFVGKITAYSYQAPINGARGSITRSGTQVRWGILAVDPLVIPLGSRVMIEGFDEVFIAEDTGGAVRGNHVEIFYPDHAAAIRFGVQTRRVTLLD